MTNVIFGSGITGLMAKVILGDSWKIVPFGRSRFFSFNPALDDNFIIADKRLDPFITSLIGSAPKYPYKIGWSYNGNIEPWSDELCTSWLQKVFGGDVPPQSMPCMRHRMQFDVYGLRINEVYDKLCNKYIDELRGSEAISEVGDHYYVSNGKRYDFDNAISTIPLDSLASFANYDMGLRAKPVHYIHLQTNDLNFEGHNQLLVVDHMFSFYKATRIAPNRYLIYAHEDIPTPGEYFMAFMPSFDLLDGSSIDSAIPVGPIPRLDHFLNMGIRCIGSYAQWDWCLDVGSCICRLLELRNEF